MTDQNVILVTGATGNVGRQVVSQLVGTGATVRAVTRDPDSAGLPRGVDVARGDLSDPTTMDACLDGVDTVFLVWPFLTSEAAPAVLDVVAEHAGRIVLLSSMGVRDDVDEQVDPINQFHADLERLIEKSGLEWTFLRSHSFATNALWWAPQIRADGVVREPYGAGADQRRARWVDLPPVRTPGADPGRAGPRHRGGDRPRAPLRGDLTRGRPAEDDRRGLACFSGGRSAQ